MTETKTPTPADQTAETVKKTVETATKAPKTGDEAKGNGSGAEDEVEETGEGLSPTTDLEVIEPSGGQIALTAHNNLDGTWSVTRGPGGRVLKDRLPKEMALAIVGADTSPDYEPKSEAEEWAIEMRKQIEQETAAEEVKDMFKSDAELKAEAAAAKGD